MTTKAVKIGNTGSNPIVVKTVTGFGASATYDSTTVAPGGEKSVDPVNQGVQVAQVVTHSGADVPVAFDVTNIGDVALTETKQVKDAMDVTEDVAAGGVRSYALGGRYDRVLITVAN